MTDMTDKDFGFPLGIGPEDATRELVDINRRAIEGIKTLSGLRQEDMLIGTADKEEVLRDAPMVLYHYKPQVDKKDLFPIPVLISYALVNRPYMVDLQEDRSLVRNLLEMGMDIYIIDWGYPRPNDRWLTLDDYVNVFMDECVDYIREAHGLNAINLLGICQGGTFSLCYTATHQEKIKNLITMVTPVDFHVSDGLLNTWMGCGKPNSAMNPDNMVKAMGNIPGDFMNFGFLMLKPFELGVQKYLGLLDVVEDMKKSANFMRMEKWIFDSPDQAGEAWKEFIEKFYIANGLIKGEVEISGNVVDLKNITVPVLNLYAENDHLASPSSSIPLKDYVGSKDYTVKSFPVGHIGMYVSGKVQRELPPTIAEWIKKHK